MNKYKKFVNDELVIKDKNLITIIKDGMQIFNPTEEMLLNDGWELYKIVPKDLYTGHLSAIIISDKLAYEGLYDILSAIMRNPESIKKLFLIIAKNVESVDVLKTLSPLENFLTNHPASVRRYQTGQRKSFSSR